MATLIDWSELSAKIESYNDLFECDTKSVALGYVVLETILGLLPEDIEDSITDGSQDRGVDAVYIDESDKTTVHLFQFKYVTKFEKASHNYPSNEIDKVLSFVTDLLSKDHKMGFLAQRPESVHSRGLAS